jgi:aminopeptidase N
MLTGRTLTCLAFSSCLLAGGCSSEDNNTSSTATSSAGASGSTTGSASSGSGGGPTGDLTGTIPRYDYTFDLATAAAHSKLSVDVAPPGGNCFTVACDVSAVSDGTWNDAPALEGTLNAGALRMCGPGVAAGEPLSIGSSETVPLNTFLGLDVGFSRTYNKAGGKFTYLLSWVGGCDHFGPCDDDPSRLSEFHFEVTHAAGETVLCPGTLTAGATTTRCDLAGTLAPTYSGFAIASDPDWVRAPYATIGGVDLVFYEVPSGQIASSLDQASVTEFFNWITDLLGPFPYGSELRFAGGPTAWLGFEHPANIVFNENLPSLSTSYADVTMHVFMHEVIHQWAGDRTTLAEVGDFVWKEATAEYLAYVFEDERRPPGEAAATRAYWDGISLQSLHYPRPTDNPLPPVQSFYGDVYGPGPMVLYLQLESLLGRATVLNGIKAFLAQPGAQSAQALADALSTASSMDVGPYFDAWVFGTGVPEWPTFAISTSEVGGEVTVTVMQQNMSGKLYGCAVEVEVQGATQSAVAVVDFGVAPQSDTATAMVTLGEPVVSTTLDPNHKLVARDAAVPLVAEPLEPLPVWIF